MKQHLAPYQDSRRSVIHLGVLPILHQYRLNPVLRQFAESHPEITLMIDEVEDEPLRQGFRHGSYDLIIGRPELLTGVQSTCHLLAHDRLVLLTPTDHPLAGRAAVPLEELSGESFILMHPDSSIHRLCLTACQKKGFQPAVNRTAKIESIVSAVAAGEAVSLLPYSNLDVFRHENVVVIPLQEPVAANVVLACLSPKKKLLTLQPDSLENTYPRKSVLTKKEAVQNSLCAASSLFILRSYRFSSIDTPAILMFTSSTVSPVMFSIALFTLSCTFSQTSGMLKPYLMFKDKSTDTCSSVTSTFTPLDKFFIPSFPTSSLVMLPAIESTPSTSVAARPAMMATTSSAICTSPILSFHILYEYFCSLSLPQ